MKKKELDITLNSPVSDLKYISVNYAEKLSGLGIYNVRDLLTHFPRNYIDTTDIKELGDLENYNGEVVTIKCQIAKISNIRIPGSRTMQIGTLVDSETKAKLYWFNQPYVVNQFSFAETYYVRGKIKIKGSQIQLFPSSVEKEQPLQNSLGIITPEYKLAKGISKNWIRKRIRELLQLVKEDKIKLKDSIWIPNLHSYIEFAHFPNAITKIKDIIDNLSIIEIASILIHLKKDNKKLQKSKIDLANLDIFKTILNNLDFSLTTDQTFVLETIIEKLKNKQILHDLIQGDVGSGKTIVALILSAIFASNGHQVAIIVPTTILANQHYKVATKYLQNTGIDVRLITSQTKEFVGQNSEILIGTTAILKRKETLLTNLQLLIIDEQHRFGVKQRELVDQYGNSISKIELTATPIPRTIAETFFETIQVHRINTKPKGRKTIKSFLVPKNKRENCYKWIDSHISKTNNQAYWVMPLIEESDINSEVKNVKKEYKILKEIFANKTVEMIHGKMKNSEKTEIMNRFNNREIDILISTTVIEVGVDNANATIMVIENAEKFGLAQLHQIRGRVGRGMDDSYCYFFAEYESGDEVEKRLEFVCRTENGIEIAEYDLERRGPGEVYGTIQSGIPGTKIAKLNNISLIVKARELVLNLQKQKIFDIDLFKFKKAV